MRGAQHVHSTHHHVHPIRGSTRISYHLELRWCACASRMCELCEVCTSCPMCCFSITLALTGAKHLLCIGTYLSDGLVWDTSCCQANVHHDVCTHTLWRIFFFSSVSDTGVCRYVLKKILWELVRSLMLCMCLIWVKLCTFLREQCRKILFWVILAWKTVLAEATEFNHEVLSCLSCCLRKDLWSSVKNCEARIAQINSALLQTLCLEICWHSSCIVRVPQYLVQNRKSFLVSQLIPLVIFEEETSFCLSPCEK